VEIDGLSLTAAIEETIKTAWPIATPSSLISVDPFQDREGREPHLRMKILTVAIEPQVIERARQDCLAEIQRQFAGDYARQGRMRVPLFPSDPVTRIVNQLATMLGFPFRVDRSGVQVQQPDGRHGQHWHQDWGAMANPHAIGVTAWIPLDPIDGTRPSLEFAGELPPLAHEYDARGYALTSHPELAIHPTPLLNLSIGDVVIFSPRELHRTFVAPSMTRPRLSLDLRFIQ
jgi:ectoine hydroxylase-related dioxygenase (phytanoyl-CoA dioxygenase family)